MKNKARLYITIAVACIFLIAIYILNSQKTKNVNTEGKNQEIIPADEKLSSQYPDTGELFRSGDDEAPAPGKKPITRVDVNLLREKFPGNLALPSMNEEEKEKKKKEKDRRSKAFGQIEANRASVEEIKAFYAEQRRIAEDAVQLLEFVLEHYWNDFTEVQQKKHKFLLEQFKTRIGLLPKREADAIKRLEELKKKKETPGN